MTGNNKLFVSNLDFEVQTDQLKELFEGIGSVVNIVIAQDRETKRSKGFAFVELRSEDDAKKAIDKLNNQEVNGRPMKVAFDRGKGGGSSSGPGERRGPREYLPPIQRTMLFRRKRKLDPFMEDPKKSIDYRDVSLLSKFTSDRGKILSRRLTGLTAYNQRKVKKAIKRAQSLGLMPYRNE